MTKESYVTGLPRYVSDAVERLEKEFDIVKVEFQGGEWGFQIQEEKNGEREDLIYATFQMNRKSIREATRYLLLSFSKEP